MAALRTLLNELDVLLHQLKGLPEHLRSHLSASLQPPILCRDVPFAYERPLQQIYEAAKDVEGDATQMRVLAAAVLRALQFLQGLDTNTAGELLFSSCIQRPDALGPDVDDTDSLSMMSTWLQRTHIIFGQTLERLESQKGPEPRISLTWLVWELCDLWQGETGQAVTSSAVANGMYKGRPRSASGQFVVAAVFALQPSAEWIEEHKFSGMPVRARTSIGPSEDLERSIHYAMRDYVAEHHPAGRRPGRPRGRQ
jgi:hypothetical protein